MESERNEREWNDVGAEKRQPPNTKCPKGSDDDDDDGDAAAAATTAAAEAKAATRQSEAGRAVSLDDFVKRLTHATF